MAYAGIDITGQTFGRLTVLERAGTRRGYVTWTCRCVCGQVKVARGDLLRKGLTTSCGCYQREVAREHAVSLSTHGLARTRTYRSWQNMKQRCNNPKAPNYKWYGGRGVTYDPRWESFENFLADMGLRPEATSLDRVSPDGNYGPDNCRWADSYTQATNLRKKKEHV